MEDQKPLPKFDAEKAAALLVRLKRLKEEMDSLILSDKELKKEWLKQRLSNLN
ncbi:MAG: hypothetical protein J7604_10370 [Sporocytophaga sp.]|uniref:hypothetical protein n=1 Tax=Sporocytophaga sp. TaxID=2231183 RepID=UPI001B200942|nr:hypothetical protein [Sporocytophaga sp.]MBO9700603.1 hypothetical protein [Sporocytophaga sp.]